MIRVIEKDRGWKALKKEIAMLENSYVAVGVLSDAGEYADGEAIASIAAQNEFGTSRIPSRPFMAQSFDNNHPDVLKFAKTQFGFVLDGKIGTQLALESLGVYFQGVVREEIAGGDFEPNHPKTIAKKKSSKPLIDTGRLRQSINFEVKLKS